MEAMFKLDVCWLAVGFTWELELHLGSQQIVIHRGLAQWIMGVVKAVRGSYIKVFSVVKGRGWTVIQGCSKQG